MPRVTFKRAEPDAEQKHPAGVFPVHLAKTGELVAAEAALAALLVEGDQYENLRTTAIEEADVEGLLRVEARSTVLPSLIDSAEVTVHHARIDWLRACMRLLDDPIRQHVDAVSTLTEERNRIDTELGHRGFVISELDGRREGLRREMRASEVRRDELTAKSPASRRRHALLRGNQGAPS